MSKVKPPNARVNAQIGPETQRALKMVVEREGVTLVEALRRLVGYGEIVYKAAKIDGEDVLLRKGSKTREVIVL